MIQKVFNRYEKKYMLTEQEYRALRQRLAEYMEEDRYGLHTIRNIYYDTKDDELIRTSLEKPRYKEKFRVRCYGTPSEDSSYFLEIKKKYKGIVNKRRIALKPEEAKAYLERGEKPAVQSQIFKEIDYVRHHYELFPKVYLAYDRIALFGKEDPEFRVTFDQNIRSRDFALTLEKDTDTTRLLEEGYYLMEVKICRAMPLWFVKILTDLGIHSTSFSKYGNVYRKSLEGKIRSEKDPEGKIRSEKGPEGKIRNGKDPEGKIRSEKDPEGKIRSGKGPEMEEEEVRKEDQKENLEENGGRVAC